MGTVVDIPVCLARLHPANHVRDVAALPAPDWSHSGFLASELASDRDGMAASANLQGAGAERRALADH